MTRHRFFIAALIVILAAGTALLAGQTRMRSGEAAIFLKSGDSIIDKIIDISSERLVLETENNGEFPLRDIWMINFINDTWNFPEERNQLETRDHYVFMRNGGVSAGRIVDFSSEQRVFQFESGEEFPIGQVRRIYFSKNVPGSLSGGQGGGQQGGGSANVWVGAFSRQTPAPPMEIALEENGTARMTIEAVGGREIVLAGTWEHVDAGSVRVTVTNQANRSDRRTMIFGLERNTLISLSGSLGNNVRLQRR